MICIRSAPLLFAHIHAHDAVFAKETADKIENVLIKGIKEEYLSDVCGKVVLAIADLVH
jgi:hypothetical protein